MRNTIMARKKLFHDCKPMFESMFKLSFDDYWDTMSGFDICKFDDDIKCPDGISLKDFLTEQYGEKASNLIEILIK